MANLSNVNTRWGGERDGYQSDGCRVILRNNGLDLVENDWSSMGVFVGETAVDPDTAVYAGKEGRIEALHDDVGIGEVGEAVRG